MDRLDDLVHRVLAPNPGPMTLEGTNTYLVGAPATGEVVVVDPGPDLAEHRGAVEQGAAALDARIAGVVLTHHHRDHAQAAGWAHDWDVPLWAFAPDLVAKAAPSATPAALADGRTLELAGVRLQAVHTPGHSSDHLCLRVMDTDVVLTGDHVLGRGTTVVVWPDGDMADYMASLRRVAALPATALYPGHGPALADPAAKVREYLAHRDERERQVLDALRAGDDAPMAVVKRVYADVDEALHGAAARSVQAHLEKLVREGAVVRDGDPREEGTTYRVR
ncbi:MAG TPA: MBL fold metallo-hydrolase [Egibacteraceae bacterium]|nr:MBL fold metallo-hydrolase [Egibacteraceae bacterium]